MINVSNQLLLDLLIFLKTIQDGKLAVNKNGKLMSDRFKLLIEANHLSTRIKEYLSDEEKMSIAKVISLLNK